MSHPDCAHGRFWRYKLASDPLYGVGWHQYNLVLDPIGRNGGHLLPMPFTDFRAKASAHGTPAAVRGSALERYAANSILETLKVGNLSKAVDLVNGGHIMMFLTGEEADGVRKDWIAAGEAGVAMEIEGRSMEWLSKEGMMKASGFLW